MLLYFDPSALTIANFVKVAFSVNAIVLYLIAAITYFYKKKKLPLVFSILVDYYISLSAIMMFSKVIFVDCSSAVFSLVIFFYAMFNISFLSMCIISEFWREENANKDMYDMDYIKKSFYDGWLFFCKILSSNVDITKFFFFIFMYLFCVIAIFNFYYYIIFFPFYLIFILFYFFLNIAAFVYLLD